MQGSGGTCMAALPTCLHSVTRIGRDAAGATLARCITERSDLPAVHQQLGDGRHGTQWPRMRAHTYASQSEAGQAKASLSSSSA